MYILGVIIIILLIRMIKNQHVMDTHICENDRTYRMEDYVCFDGLINKIIFRITVIYENIKYYLFKKGSK